tara:strand:- start:4425 stop:5012 length:588 start_codon:yes stop_codon:yes gene_type:complete
MNYSFEYIDIILLAMIAGFIFLRLRGILGKKSGYEEDMTRSFAHDFPKTKPVNKVNLDTFDENAKKDFLEGAKIAYENIITEFSNGNLNNIKNLLDQKVFKTFDDALSSRKKDGHKSETTFIGINSAEIKKHEKRGNFLEVTVEFVSEIISCVKDKDSKIIAGDPNKVKKVHDTWKFSKDVKSNDPNWALIETNI